MAGLADYLTARYRKPTVKVYLDERAIAAPNRVLDVTIDEGYDVGIATATVRLLQKPSWFAYNRKVAIYLGWNGFTELCFEGYVPAKGMRAGPSSCTLSCRGWLSKAKAETATDVSYSSQGGTAIVGALLTASGITKYALDDGGITFGVVKPVQLLDGQSYLSLIQRVDQTEEMATFDCPDGVARRMAVNRVPSDSTAYDFAEGQNDCYLLGEPEASEDTEAIRNRVIVRGRPDGDWAPFAARQAANSYVDNPGGLRVFNFSSDLIETDEVADTVCQRKMLNFNRLVRPIRFRTPGHPYLLPGMTLGFTSASLDIATKVHGWCRHLRHVFSASVGFETEVTLETGVGDAGYSTGRPPIAMFEMTVERETVLIGGVATTIYVVNAESTSSDLDTPSDQLTLAWSNNKNATTGTGKFYTTYFTQAQMDAATKPAITLVVADPQANSDTTTLEVLADEYTVIVREYAHAFLGRAEATGDGGENWQTWAPTDGGHVISTPPISHLAEQWWGLDNGKLVRSLDYLMSAPALMRDFDSAVNALWWNESDSDRMSVGLENGEVWAATAGPTGTWSKLYTFPAPVVWIEESAFYPGQYRVCTGEKEYYTDNSFGGVVEGASWPSGTACKTALSETAGNWACAIDTAGGQPVKRELGAALGLPVLAPVVNDVRAITCDIRRDRVYFVDRSGRAFVKIEGAETATQKTSIPGATGVNFGIRDGDLPEVSYWCDESAGLVKTIDGMNTWFTMRQGDGVNLRSRMVGYGSQPLNVVDLPTTYRRVVAAGGYYTGVSATSVPHFAYTENVYDGSPTWVANDNGLPASGILTNLLLDPFAPGSRAYVHCGTDVYRNDAYRSGGAWTKILDQTIVQTLINPVFFAAGFWLSPIDTTLALDGRLYAAVLGLNFSQASWWNAWMLKSDDHGATWTASAQAALPGSHPNIPVVGASQRNADLCYVLYMCYAGGATQAAKTTDAGATLTLLGGLADTNGHSIALPYQGNENSQKALAMLYDAPWQQTDDGGATWTPTGYSGNIRAQYASWDSSLLYAPNSLDLLKSEDGAASFGVLKTFTALALSVATPVAGRLFVGGGTGGTGPTNWPAFVQVSVDDGATWLDHTGNLPTLFGGATYTRVNSIAVDPTV
jgi:hypothetical protein